MFFLQFLCKFFSSVFVLFFTVLYVYKFLFYLPINSVVSGEAIFQNGYICSAFFIYACLDEDKFFYVSDTFSNLWEILSINCPVSSDRLRFPYAIILCFVPIGYFLLVFECRQVSCRIFFFKYHIFILLCRVDSF